MNFSCIFFGAFFIITGFMFAFGKVHIHLSVWKNMPQEERKKIDIVPLCRNIGGVIALSGISFLLKGLWNGFTDHRFVGAMIIWFAVAGLDVINIRKSNKYCKNNQQ